MKAIYESLKDKEAIVKNLQHFSKLETFFNSSEQSEELRKFCESMESGFYRPGQILSTWRFLHLTGGKKNKE